MNTMDCKDIKALLSAIVDDELDAEHRHAAERHLADCADCRAILNEAEGLSDLIALDARSRSDSISLPAGFEQRVLQRTVYADGLPLRRQRIGAWTGWFAAAASLTLAGVLWFNDRPQSVPGDGSLAMTGQEAMNDRSQTPSSRSGQPVVRPATYTTGVNLRSQTFDGGLPADAFRVQNAAMTDLTMPYDPVFAWSGDAQRDSGTALIGAPIARDDADTLYSSSLLIDMFGEADLQSFTDIERIREVIDLDELLPRLTATRMRLSDADRPLVFAAESVLLRIAHGPLDHDDAAELQELVERMRLAAALEAMSER